MTHPIVRILGRLGFAGSMAGELSAPRPVPVAQHGPHVRDSVNLATLRRCMVLALAPCLLVALYNTGHQAGLGLARLGLDALPGWRGTLLGAWAPEAGAARAILRGMVFVLPILVVALITGVFWRLVFARLRRRDFAGVPVVTALVFTLILPPGAPLWQVALGMSFGLVIGKEIFGGAGKNFMNPALVGLAFLYLAYPGDPVADPVWTGGASYGGTGLLGQVAAGGMDALTRAGVTWWDSFLGIEPDAIGVSSAAACILGAMVLIVTGVGSWRVMLAVLTGGVATALVADAVGSGAGPVFSVPWYWHITLGGFAFGTVFLTTDPASAASTNTGRFGCGLLIGAMIVLVRIANPSHPDGVLMAVLLGNVLAPLIDYGVVWANIRRRVRRGG